MALINSHLINIRIHNMISPKMVIWLSFGAFVLAMVILIISFVRLPKTKEAYTYESVVDDREPHNVRPCEPALFTPSAYMSYVGNQSYRQGW